MFALPTSPDCLRLPLADSAGFFPPIVILILCIIAGIGTVLLLPGRRERSISKIGGFILLAALLIFTAILVRQGARSTAGEVYFWVFSFIAIISAIRVVTHTKPVYSALYFVLTVVASAGLFVLLWAEFMAAALILIYAGAILVTYVFVIMLASQAQTAGPGLLEGGADYDRFSREPLFASAVGFLLMGMLLFLIFEKAAGLSAPGKPKPESIRDLGAYLFTSQLVTLELAGLILTLAMVGAVIIARRPVEGADATGGEFAVEGQSEQIVVAPLTPLDDNPHSIPVYGTDNPEAKSYPEA